jgi:hypothetical protein
LLLNNKDAYPINNLEDANQLITFVNLKFNKVETVRTVDDVMKKEKISDDVKKLNLEEIMKRFKIKSPATIEKYIKSGKFTDWSEKKDPEHFRWGYNEKEKIFYTIISETLFAK